MDRSQWEWTVNVTEDTHPEGQGLPPHKMFIVYLVKETIS